MTCGRRPLLASHPSSSSRKLSARMPSPSIATGNTPTPTGPALASADGYVHSSAMIVSPRLHSVITQRDQPSVLPVCTSVAKPACAGRKTRAEKACTKACSAGMPVAGPYCSAVARFSPPSPARGALGTAMRAVRSARGALPRRRQSHARGGDGGASGAAGARANESATRASPPTAAKGK